MTGAGHTLTGLIAGIPLGFFAFNMGAGVILSLLTVGACILGSTAPDWLEIPYSSYQKNKQGKKIKVIKRVLKHRGITHTLSLWVIGFIWSFLCIKNRQATLFNAELPLSLIFILFGFFSGGILHLLGDIPNKKKIPMFTPFDGIAFNMWESGKHEELTCALLFGLTVLFIFYEEPIFLALKQLI